MGKVSFDIDLNDYKYDLAEDRIAAHPLENRSDSKLLVYNDGSITHKVFHEISDHLPKNSQLVFNDTKVIPARLQFYKETGALIEIFILEPLNPTNEVASAMLVKEKCQWKCMVGNLKKWKDNTTLTHDISELSLALKVRLIDREQQIVEFEWSENIEFVHVIEAAGKIPLPPYIKREAQKADKERYQTVYSNHEGAVAAPTAGLHFDEKVLGQLKKENIKLEYLTLHVSAGTFQPVKTKNAVDHKMHAEQVVVNKSTLENLLDNRKTIAVGTTSMRTLESLYWYGVKLLDSTQDDTFFIEKLYPYQHKILPSKSTALKAIHKHMELNNLKKITGTTEIYIFPGYQFKICQGLITNYHLPESTLILLVAAFIGESWKKVYHEALEKGYRFLSYGDSSLLLP